MKYKSFRMVLVEPWQKNPDAKPFGMTFTAYTAERAASTAQWFADLRGWNLLTVKEVQNADVPALPGVSQVSQSA